MKIKGLADQSLFKNNEQEEAITAEVRFLFVAINVVVVSALVFVVVVVADVVVVDDVAVAVDVAVVVGKSLQNNEQENTNLLQSLLKLPMIKKKPI